MCLCFQNIQIQSLCLGMKILLFVWILEHKWKKFFQDVFSDAKRLSITSISRDHFLCGKVMTGKLVNWITGKLCKKSIDHWLNFDIQYANNIGFLKNNQAQLQ